MRIYIDIDQTICTGGEGMEYDKAKPMKEEIEKANRLYDAGHHIVYWTARGTETGKNWLLVTLKQLEEWGVKYHSLKMGKPAFDLLIDDRAITAGKWDEIDQYINK